MLCQFSKEENSHSHRLISAISNCHTNKSMAFVKSLERTSFKMGVIKSWMQQNWRRIACRIPFECLYNVEWIANVCFAAMRALLLIVSNGRMKKKKINNGWENKDFTKWTKFISGLISTVANGGQWIFFHFIYLLVYCVRNGCVYNLWVTVKYTIRSAMEENRLN